MGVIKKIKKRKEQKITANVIRHGFILLGFNFALILALFFSLIGTTTFMALMSFSGILLLFLPLVVIFLFAGVSAILWYRFGQILRDQFKENRIVYTAIIALISVVPLLFLLLFLASLLSVWGSATDFFITAFMGTVFITTLAVIFEIPVLVFGVLTKK